MMMQGGDFVSILEVSVAAVAATSNDLSSE